MKLPRSKPRDLNDARVLVTGGAKGIGYVLTTALCRQGAHVVMAGRDEVAGRRAVDELAERELTATFVCMDLRDEVSICAGAAETLEHLGRLDALVHNASLAMAGAIDSLEWSKSADSLDAILRGPAVLTRELLPALRQSERASIVCISSLSASRGYSHASMYAAAKRGLEAMAECWYEELRDQGIRVSIIAPSFVHHPLLPEDKGTFLAGSELDPWDVADALEYVLRARPTVCPLRVELRLTRTPWADTE